jgi:hypothetical protein
MIIFIMGMEVRKLVLAMVMTGWNQY